MHGSRRQSGNQQRDLIQIVPSAFQRVDHLADDQQRRVAGIIVDIAQSLIDDSVAVIGQQLCLVSILPHDLHHHIKMNRAASSESEWYVFFHFFSKDNPFHQISKSSFRQNRISRSSPRADGNAFPFRNSA